METLSNADHLLSCVWVVTYDLGLMLMPLLTLGIIRIEIQTLSGECWLIKYEYLGSILCKLFVHLGRSVDLLLFSVEEGNIAQSSSFQGRLHWGIDDWRGCFPD